MSKQYAVIGMGRVGASLARTLDEMGHDVLGIERDADLVQDLSADLPNVNLVAADASEEHVLQDLGLARFDGAAVVIGENIQASVLVTMILKELGVPLVLARATSPLHARVLERVGADHVVQPEREFGEYLGHRMASPNIQDYLVLGEDEALVRVSTPRRWVGKTLKQLQLPRKQGITVLTLKTKDRGGTVPRADDPLKEGDVLVLAGPKKRLDELET